MGREVGARSTKKLLVDLALVYPEPKHYVYVFSPNPAERQIIKPILVVTRVVQV